MKIKQMLAEREAEERERDERRIGRQRTLMASLPPYSACERLRDAMLQRAYELLTNGNADGCDALLEFLPETKARATLDAWLDDQFDEIEPSQFYHNKEWR